MSLLNRSNFPRNTTIDRSMATIATNRKVEEMLRNANEAFQSLLLPKYQDTLLSISNKQIDELEARVKQLQSQNDEIIYMK